MIDPENMARAQAADIVDEIDIYGRNWVLPRFPNEERLITIIAALMLIAARRKPAVAP